MNPPGRDGADEMGVPGRDGLRLSRFAAARAEAIRPLEKKSRNHLADSLRHSGEWR
jgi:hypothetical protein